MEWQLLLLILLTLPDNFTAELYYSTSEVDWFSARDTCRSMGGRLLTPTSFAAVQALDTRDWDRFWVGWSDKETEGVFLADDGNTLDPNSSLWLTNNPDDYGSDEDCVEAFTVEDDQGFINDVSCTFISNFICEGTQNYYYYGTTAVTWFEARDECETRSGRLLSPTTSEEIAAADVHGWDFWTAWNDIKHEGAWVNDNSYLLDLVSPLWAPNHPTRGNGERCSAYGQADSKLHAAPCDMTTHNFICVLHFMEVDDDASELDSIYLFVRSSEQFQVGENGQNRVISFTVYLAGTDGSRTSPMTSGIMLGIENDDTTPNGFVLSFSEPGATSFSKAPAACFEISDSYGFIKTPVTGCTAFVLKQTSQTISSLTILPEVHESISFAETTSNISITYETSTGFTTEVMHYSGTSIQISNPSLVESFRLNATVSIHNGWVLHSSGEYCLTPPRVNVSLVVQSAVDKHGFTLNFPERIYYFLANDENGRHIVHWNSETPLAGWTLTGRTSGARHSVYLMPRCYVRDRSATYRTVDGEMVSLTFCTEPSIIDGSRLKIESSNATTLAIWDIIPTPGTLNSHVIIHLQCQHAGHTVQIIPAGNSLTASGLASGCLYSVDIYNYCDDVVSADVLHLEHHTRPQEISQAEVLEVTATEIKVGGVRSDSHFDGFTIQAFSDGWESEIVFSSTEMATIGGLVPATVYGVVLFAVAGAYSSDIPFLLTTETGSAQVKLATFRGDSNYTFIIQWKDVSVDGIDLKIDCEHPIWAFQQFFSEYKGPYTLMLVSSPCVFTIAVTYEGYIVEQRFIEEIQLPGANIHLGYVLDELSKEITLTVSSLQGTAESTENPQITLTVSSLQGTAESTENPPETTRHPHYASLKPRSLVLTVVLSVAAMLSMTAIAAAVSSVLTRRFLSRPPHSFRAHNFEMTERHAVATAADAPPASLDNPSGGVINEELGRKGKPPLIAVNNPLPVMDTIEVYNGIPTLRDNTPTGRLNWLMR